MNSLSMRTKGAALATACDWLFNYAVVQTTPIGIQYLHWGLYLVYAILNAAFVPIIYYLIVETAGKSLEQIDKWFAVNPGWLVHKASDVSYVEKISAAKEDREAGLGVAEESEWLVRDADGVGVANGHDDEDADDGFVYDDDMHSIGTAGSEDSYGRMENGSDLQGSR